MGEHEDKKTRINTKAFWGDMHTEPTHIITTLANIDAMGCLALEFDKYNEASQPLMMR